MEDSTVLALPGAVRWPPTNLAVEPDSPFDLASFFSRVPESENAAPLYLDALSEFDVGMAACFPEHQRAAVHERGLRRQEKLAQILFAILWWWIGRSRGLTIASGIGFVCGVGLGVVAILFAQWWLLATAVFLCYGALTGLRTARKLAPLDRAPRRAEYACPACGSHPPVGPFWNCSQCGTATDVFDPLQVCPTCRMVFLAVACVECGQQRFGGEWVLPYSIVAD